MQLIKPCLLFALLLLCAFSFAQKEGNTWYFGINTGLNFNVSPPAILTNGQTSSREGVATISDRVTGQLLFYTEGTKVWNRNHVTMPNGTGLLGDYSSAQSAIAVPKPGNNNRYYLFTTALMRGMHYSEVDMTLAGGNGDVIAATKNTPLISGGESSEKLMAVKHCNGVDYWVITHKLFSSSFVVYLVNAAGVQPAATYNIGAVLADAANWTGVGYLKLSSTGGRLAHVIGPAGSGQLSNVELLNFDNKTGAITGPVVQLTGFDVPYGAEFSPQGRYLYISENLGRRVAQYDLAAPNINLSRIVVQTSPNLNYGALQLGPDGKIYAAAENGYDIGYNFLARIDNPEGAGATCNFVANAVNLGTGRALIGLPTIAANYFLKDSSYIQYTGACTNTNGTFSFSTTANIDSVKWNFGDGSPTATQLSPTHSYTNPNTYNVQLILYKSCNKNDTIQKPVTITDCVSDCNNWLATTNYGRYATVGDIDVTGTQLTVEATFNAQSYNSGLFLGHLVAKHTTGTNVNYALSATACEITTTTGYYSTAQTCELQFNKTYHAAMVYDGTTLKFYRNGFLMSQVACTGSMINNNLLTTLGQVSGGSTPAITQFLGYINEVRIWNVARTQAQLQTYMNNSLPNPTTQTGLLGYYTFDNLLNKQGNAAFNGVLQGGAVINATNPNCSFIADSCRVNTPISNIINAYTPVLGLAACDNKLMVQDGSAYNVGDTVLLIQMKGAVIDSTNTGTFGTITDYKSAGNYEFNYVKAKVGNVIELTNRLTRTYEVPHGKVQLIRVPYYDNATVNNRLTCLPWDGEKGGVLVLNVKDTLKLNENIDVTGRGFRGGNTFTIAPAGRSCFQSDFFYDSTSTVSSRKGEGIASIGTDKLNGRGALANGGGGGNGYNAGGGGGSNAGLAGWGGYQLYECSMSNYDNRGMGGKPLAYGNTLNKIYMGGGGGAGHKDGLPTNPLSSKGGNGGGIVIIKADKLISNAFSISANGNGGSQCNIDGFPCISHDGEGGGGGGGTLLLDIANYIGNSRGNANGGKGADVLIYNSDTGHVGPGGGGGGGAIWLKQPSVPAAITATNNGGNNGVIVLDGNNPFGATQGVTGAILFNLQMPVSSIPFSRNIDSVRIKDSVTTCGTFDFKGVDYTNTFPIAQWQWYFGDGGAANTQNTSHTYTNAGTYTVKLVVTDINGCKDSTMKLVTVVDCDNILCKSSFGFRIPDNAIVDIVPAGTGAFSQLYSTNGFTWEAWYRPNGNIVNRSLILSTEDAVLFQDIFLGFGWGATPNALSFLISDNGTTNATASVESLQTLNPNTWYHVAGVCDYNAAQLRLYLNGTLVGTAAIPANILNNRMSGNRLTQIGNASARASAVDGLIDEVRFWATARTTTQIQSNANICLPVPQASLVAYFKADENRGLTSKSEVDNNFSATLRNATWGEQAANINCAALSMTDNVVDCNRLFVTAQLLNGITSAQIVQWQWTFGDGGTATTQNAAHVYTADGTYPVKLVITDINGCKDSVTRNVTVALLIAEAGRDTAICTNAAVSINLLASGGTGYSWSPATLVDNAAIANPVATLSNTTKFYVTVTNAIPGCSVIDSVTITINPVPTVVANRDTAICRTVPLGLVATGAASYVWAPVSAIDNPTIANPNFIGTQNEELVVTGTTAAGCRSTDTVRITVDTLPVVRTIRDTIICSTQPIVLTTTGAQTYQWNPPVFLNNPNIASPTYSGNTSQTYEVVGANGNGCIGKDTVAVTVRLLAAIRAPRDTSVCRGETVRLNGNNGSTYQYAWSPSIGLSNPAIEHPVFNGTTTTPYTLTIAENDCNTTQRFNVLVTVNALPIITATRSNDIDCGTPFSNLMATGATQYVWTPVSGLSNSQVSNPRATPSNNTIYTVKGTDINGCSATANVEVKVLGNGKDFSEMPNSFTPNGDGLNDCYGPGRFWQNIVSMQFVIYNRWGEQVFYSTNPANCWDGMYKGVKAEQGAYVYHLRVKTTCGDIEKKGSEILIR